MSKNRREKNKRQVVTTEQVNAVFDQFCENEPDISTERAIMMTADHFQMDYGDTAALLIEGEQWQDSTPDNLDTIERQ